jgi:hypothetical protein
MEKTIWEQFQIPKYDPGAGLLYCLRYGLDRIEAHRTQVVSALQELGVQLEQRGESDVIDMFLRRPSTTSEKTRASSLASELSVLNEATEYKEAGFGYKNIEDLTTGLIVQYFTLLDTRSLAVVYDFVDLIIPQIVRGLRTADKQNKVLSSRERASLSELERFAKRQFNHLNSPVRIAVIG